MARPRASTVPSDLYRLLDGLDILTAQADERSLAALAEIEIPRLTGAWRALLREHAPDEDGRCRCCTGWFGRRRGYRCPVWVSAHQHLVVTTSTSAGRV